ncbi:MAG: alpha/beta hydrolase [Dehalococcoidales bacterium]|nr:alpha/beta hydrolase [Dehalococcoidales bacterium]
MPTASINGFVMHYETRGEGFPLVYIHGGFGGLGTGLEAQVPPWRDRFAEHFKVITYDRRAAGRSSYPEEGFTMENFARDIRELLRHLGHDRTHVWGTSAGGQIALAFGLCYPEIKGSLVITDSAPWLSLDKELKDKLRERVRILNEKGPEAAYAARATAGTVGLNLFVGRPVESEEERRLLEERMERVRAQLRETPREQRIAKYAGELRNYSAYIDWDASPRLKDLKSPTLVLYGTRDTVFPPQGDRTMTQSIPNVEYKAFHGAEHGVTQFPEAIELIFSFLQRHTPKGV